MKKISKILIANRGEIALRIIRTCKELGIKTVVIFSEVDANGLWVTMADECYVIVGNPVDAYLKYEKIIAVAKKTKCDAIHPGYGFLSENFEFAQACLDNEIIFIGPTPEHIELFGDKMASKIAMKKVGIPILEGTNTPINDKNEGENIAKKIGFPIIIKAAFGGGGRGMRIVYDAESFSEAFESATNESMKYFGKSDVFIEKYVQNPRHIEVQIIADRYNNVIHLGERDCSIQRRHQKIVEIAPSPKLNDLVRKKLFDISVNAIKKLGYENVGTIEYLIDEMDNIYFIEMNTRVQVEHPITEMISGVDIIEKMIEIASGIKIDISQDDINLSGYAIEFRINSENPQNSFMPTTGKVKKYLIPAGNGIRIDSSLYVDYELPTCYDSMVGKLIVYAKTWEKVVQKAKRALDEFFIDGFDSNISLHSQIVRDLNFIEGTFNTNYLDINMKKFNFDEINPSSEYELKRKKILKEIISIKENNIVNFENNFILY
jgi:pyruvate carboxylase subunit A